MRSLLVLYILTVCTSMLSSEQKIIKEMNGVKPHSLRKTNSAPPINTKVKNRTLPKSQSLNDCSKKLQKNPLQPIIEDVPLMANLHHIKSFKPNDKLRKNNLDRSKKLIELAMNMSIKVHDDDNANTLIYLNKRTFITRVPNLIPKSGKPLTQDDLDDEKTED